MFDLDLIRKNYKELSAKIETTKKRLGRPLTLSGKNSLLAFVCRSAAQRFQTGSRLCRFCTRPRGHAGCYRPNGTVAIHELR